ncbi:hypothetical protein N7526_004515 [Penicillium atrosanguineum]|nr:hypothetical protein N7526_004515 [Penicillium atrosanguineum]
MPICIECSYPVSHLYSAYSRADDRSQGKGVRLTQCPRCQRFADKYVEYDFVVIFIDLVLIKPQVYRHLLFNRLGRDDNRFDRSIIRLGILLLLFDVYLTWARLEKDPSLATTFVARAPIIVQYLFFLTLNAAATFAHHLTYWSQSPTAMSPPNRPAPTRPAQATPPPSHLALQHLRSGHHPRRNQTHKHNNSSAQAQLHFLQNPHLIPPSTTPPSLLDPSLLPPSAIPAPQLSSCAKLFPILLVIWGADGSGNSNLSDIQAGNTGARKDMGASKAALSSNRDSASPSFLESFLAAAESSLRPYLPTRYVTGLFGVLASLLSLGVVDTHLVLLSNIEALYILLGCGYLRAVAVAVAGQIARWAVQRVILGAVGVG